MRLVVCSANKDACSAFESVLTYPWVTIVGFAGTADELIDVLATEQVDVAICGVQWLDEWMRVQTLVESRGLVLPPWTVAGFYVTGALCLECATLPIADLIDLREGFDSAAERLLLAAKGFTARDSNEIVPSRWTKNRHYVNKAIRDEFDLQIMLRLLRGETNSEIAVNVHLSYQTVNNRISQMIHRTGSSNRTRLAMMFHDSYAFEPTDAALKPVARAL